MSSIISRRGFTLIELLIVVAIIAILAAIAVPNFLEAQVRSKVARVQTDMRTLATGIEAYRVDWNSVPLNNGNSIQATRHNYAPGPLWIALTTPVAYLTSALVDSFVAIGTHSSDLHAARDGNILDPFIQTGVGFLGTLPPGMAYEQVPKTEWVAASYGPDAADDTDLIGRYPYTRSALPYDPTNGTVSWGDIYRHGARVPTNFVIGSMFHGSNVDNTWGTGDPYIWTH